MNKINELRSKAMGIVEEKHTLEKEVDALSFDQEL